MREMPMELHITACHEFECHYGSVGTVSKQRSRVCWNQLCNKLCKYVQQTYPTPFALRFDYGWGEENIAEA